MDGTEEHLTFIDLHNLADIFIQSDLQDKTQYVVMTVQEFQMLWLGMKVKWVQLCCNPGI